MAVANMAGSQTPARCYRLPAAGPVHFRPRLLLPSPTSTCPPLSAAAAPWALSLASVGASAALRTAPRANLVGMAVSSGADPGPPSDHSHGGGRGRGRQAGSGQQAPRGQSGGRGKQDQEQERGGGSSAGQSGTAPPAPRRSADRRVPSGASGHGRGAYGKADPESSGQGSSGSGGGVFVRLSDLEHLGQLQEVVEQQAKQWAAKKDHGTLVAALERTCKLPPDPSSGQPDDAARRALLHTLAGIFRPLVPSITRPDYCTRPLWACAKAGYGWAGGADELPLAEALLRRLGQGGCALLRRAKPEEHSSLWWSLSEAPNTGLVAAQGQLLAASAEYLVGMSAKDMGAQECANVLLACARLKHSPTHVPLVHHMTRCLAEVSDPDAQALANALYALGELHEDCGHVPHREDLRQLMGAVVLRLRSGRARDAAKGFIPQHLSNMLLGCAKLGVADGEAVQLLAAAAGAEAGRMESQGLANSVWALGKLLGGGDFDAGTTSPSSGAGGDGTAAIAVTQLLSEVQRRLGPTMPGATPNDGTAGHAFISQDLSNLLYGMALLQPYIDTVPPAQGGMKDSPDGPAATTFAAATDALAGECIRRSFRGFPPQALANTAWALAKMGHADQGWFAAAVAAAQRPAFVSGALPIAWAQLWYALALARHRPPAGLVECTAGALEGQVRRLEPKQCASQLWSFAALGVWEERLAGVLLGRLAELVERQQQGQGTQGARGRAVRARSQAPLTVIEQDLANALWAVAVAGSGALAAHSREVGVLLREAARRWEQGGGSGLGEGQGPFIREHLQQLWQVQLELEAMEGGEAAALSRILPGARCGVGGGATAAPGRLSMRAALEHAATKRGEVLGGASASASQLQQDVVAALRRLQRRQQDQQQPHASPVPASEPPQCHAAGVTAPGGTRGTFEGCSGAAAPLVIIDVQHEAPVPALGTRVDVLVPLSDGRVMAMEVDGPVHYMSNKPYDRTKDGPTTLRDRQLARVFGQGNVVSVPYWEWNALQGNKAGEEQYVWGLLAGGEEAEGAGREAAADHPTQRGTGRKARQGEGKERRASEVAAPAGALGTAEGEARKRRRRRQQAGEQGREQQQVQLEREPPAAAACAPAGGVAGGAVAGGPSGGPSVVERKGNGRRRHCEEEETAGAAGSGTGQGRHPAQAPPDGAAPRVLVPRRRRQKVQDFAQAP